MRSNQDAAVDSQGAHNQADPSQTKEVQDFQTFTAILLSVQTKDEITDMVMKNLWKVGFNLDIALTIPEPELKELIKQVNFNAKKVTYIKSCAQIIKEKYNGKIPEDYDKLIDLPGVGPKIANLFLQIAHNKVVGISVDTHIHRISNRIGWVNTKSPEQTKDQLEQFIDKSYWSRINQLLVGFGQQICNAKNPNCSECLINKKCKEGLRRIRNRSNSNSKNENSN